MLQIFFTLLSQWQHIAQTESAQFLRIHINSFIMHIINFMTIYFGNTLFKPSYLAFIKMKWFIKHYNVVVSHLRTFLSTTVTPKEHL